MVKDIEIIDIIFRYLYAKNSCEDIKKAVYETTGENISSKECFRLFRLVQSTGLIKEFSYAVGTHNRTFALNDAGYQMMLHYGSYKIYLVSKQQEQKKASTNEELERKSLELEVEKKVIEKKYKPWEIAFAVVGVISTLILLTGYLFKAIKGLIP